MTPVRIPRHADEPVMLLFWSIDEAVPFILLFMVGIIMHEQIISLIVGYFFTKMYVKLKDNTADGFALHFFYWMGLFTPKNIISIPSPFIRRFLQ